jgi:putative transposase
MDDRKAFEAIVYVLRSGMQWNALPREVGASSTCMIAFRNGNERAVAEYDDLAGIQWEWQAVDGVMTKAPAGRRRDRSQPDRSRQMWH